jgi:23S rRNA A2030 N6-methylase RlmJ
MMQRTIAAGPLTKFFFLKQNNCLTEVITAYIERIRSSNINSSTSNSSKECINLDAKKGPTKVSRHLSSESDESDSYETKKPEKKQNTKKLNTKQREKVNEKNIGIITFV